jgi:hypothetical protein
MATCDQQVQRMFGIRSREFNKAKMSRNATMVTTRQAKPPEQIAKMTRDERRRSLLAGDATHQLLQLVRATARQEGLTTAVLMSALIDRVYTATHAADLAPDEAVDSLTGFMSDVGRLCRMREIHTEDREGYDNLRASLWNRFSKIIGTGDDDFLDDTPDDDDPSVNPDPSGNPDDDTSAVTLESNPNPTGSLYNDESTDVANDVTGRRADSLAPSPIDKNPVTKTKPGFVSRPTRSFHQVSHFAAHTTAHPTSNGLLLNVSQREFAAAARKNSKV